MEQLELTQYFAFELPMITASCDITHQTHDVPHRMVAVAQILFRVPYCVKTFLFFHDLPNDKGRLKNTVNSSTNIYLNLRIFIIELNSINVNRCFLPFL